MAHNCHSKTKNLTAKPKTSRQNQKPHGKTKNLTTKPKTSRQNQKPHGKNKNLTAKTKYLTAKTKTSRQKQNIFGFVNIRNFSTRLPMIFGGCCWFFFLVKKGAPEIFGVNAKRPLYNFLMKVKLLYVLELSTGPIRVANSFG